jgi:sulfur carrier protein
MEIFLNNKPENVNQDASLDEIVTCCLGDKQKGIAVAVNETVVPKDLWQSTILKTNDNVLIIKATQGG